MKSVENTYKSSVLLILLLVSVCLHAAPNTPVVESVSGIGGLELNKNRFFRFNNSIELSFDLSLQKGYNQYFGYVVRITDLNKETTELILNLQENDQNELIIISNNKLSKRNINLKKEDFQENPIHFKLLFDLKSDELTLIIKDIVYVENHLGLRPHSDYRIIIGVTKNQESLLTKTSGLLISNIETSPDLIGTGKLAKNRVSTLLWVIIIVLLDIIIFVYIIWKRRKKRKREIESDSANQSVESNADVTYHFEKETRIEKQHKSTILLFNHFQVFDKEGNEISKKFSPLIKELFLIILLYSQKDKQGINTGILKDLLWFDKESQSANNNRAVNIGKLKSILDTVEDYDIISNNQNISIKLGDAIYCDYTLVLDLLQQDCLAKEQVLVLVAISERGAFLPECNYEWMDRFKEAISDSLIDKLLGIAKLLKVEIDAKLILQIADTIFNFDNLNEKALILKCSTLMYLGRHSIANATYMRFIKDYQNVYQEPYEVQFLEVCNYFSRN